MKKSGKIGIFFFFLLALLAPSFAGIGIYHNITSQQYIMNNSDDLPFIFNETNGRQVTNDYSGFWSYNDICLKIKTVVSTVTNYPMNCLGDDLKWSWQSDTDNKTYANLTASTTWGVARNYAVKLTMEYYLNSKDRRIQITPTIENTGNKSTDAWIIWRVHDIKINNSKYNNWIRVWNGSQTEYRLNDSLNLIFSNLTQKSYYLHEVTDEYWMQTDWASDTYELDIYKNASEYNAIVDLSFPQGTLTTTASRAKKVGSKMWWIDALCTWSCVKSLPNGVVQLYQGSSTAMSGYWTGTGTCPSSRSLYGQFANYTTFYSLTNTGNLSKLNSEFNPQSTGNGPDFTADWTVKGNDVTNGTAYPVKIVCDTTDSPQASINVSTRPPYQCAQISASTTLTSSKTGVCYNLTASNIIFDCAGKTISGNSSPFYHPAFLMQNINNITIKNCLMNSYSTGFYVNNSANNSFFNNTLYQFNISTPSFYDDAIGFAMFNTNNITISDTTESNFSVNRGGTSNAGGYGWFMIATNTTRLTVQNVSIFNNSGQYNSGGESSNLGFGFYFLSVLNHTYLNNITFNSIDTALHMGSVTGQDSMVSNVTMVNMRGTGILTNFPSQFQDISITLSSYATGISFQHGADNSNLTRYNFTGVNSSSGDKGVNLADSTGNPYLNNVTISDVVINMSWYGISLHQAYGNRFLNLSINNTNWCVWDDAGGTYINNLTCDWANRTIDVQLADDTFGATMNTIISNSTLIYRPSKTTWVYKSIIAPNVYFINTTGNFTNRTMNTGDDLWVQWYARVNVTDATGSPLTSTINDTQNSTTGNQTFYGYYSLSPWYIVNDTHYTGASAFQAYNNHTITANNSLANPTSNTTSVNITGRDWTINLTLCTDITPPILTLVYPTDLNLTVARSWSYVNVSSNEPLSNAMVKWNGTWYVLTSLNTTVWYKNITSLGDGNYTFNVTANDTSLNQNTTETRWVNIDTTPPTLTLISPTAPNNSNLSQNWIYVNVSSNEALNNSMLKLNGTWYTMSRLNSTAWYLNVTGLVDGTYVYNVTANDTVNNSAISETRNVTLDTVAPSITLVFPTASNNGYFSRSWIYINATTSEPTVNASVNLNGTIYYLLKFNSTLWYRNVTALPDGYYLYNVSANDSANNVGISETRNLTLDTVAPTLAFVFPTPLSGNTTNQSSLYLNVTCSEECTNVSIVTKNYLNTQTKYYLLKDSGTNWHFNITDITLDQIVNYQAFGNDTANNTGSSSTSTITFYLCGVPHGTLTLLYDVAANQTCFSLSSAVTLDCNGHTVSYSTVSGNFGYGVLADFFVTGGGSGSTIKNCIFNRGSSSSQSGAIKMNTVGSITLTNVTALNNQGTDAAIFVVGSTDINISNSNLSCSGSPCPTVIFSDSSVPSQRNEIWNSTLTATSGSAFYAINSFNLKVFNSNLTAASGQAIRILQNVNQTLFKNSYINGSTTIAIQGGNTYENILLNDTMPSFTYSVPSSSNFTVQWYGRINVTDISTSPVQATLNLTNNQSQNVFNGLVGANGLTDWLIVNDTRYGSSSNLLYNNHSINVNYTGYAVNFSYFNFSRADSTVNITLYRQTPVLAYVSPTPNGDNISQTWVYVNITSDIPLDNASLNWNGTNYYMQNSSQLNWYLNMTSQPDGTYNFNVSANSTYGINATLPTRNATLDTVKPTITLVPITPANNAYLSQSWLYVNATVSESMPSLTLNLNGTAYSMFQSSQFVWYRNLTLADGYYVYNVSGSDYAGNSNISETRNVTLDTVAPSITFVSSTPTDGSTILTNTFFINATISEPVANVSLLLDGNLYYMLKNTSTLWQFTTPILADGMHVFNASTNDTALNSNVSETRYVTTDSTPPILTFELPTPLNGSLVQKTWFIINISTARAVVNASVDMNNLTYYMHKESSTSWYLNMTNLTNGIYAFNVSANDSFGRIGSTETRYVTIFITAPSIPSVPLGGKPPSAITGLVAARPLFPQWVTLAYIAVLISAMVGIYYLWDMRNELFVFELVPFIGKEEEQEEEA